MNKQIFLINQRLSRWFNNLGVLNLMLTMILFCGSFTWAATPLWQGQGRIAISSDGNEHDHDDWAATPFSLALLAAAGLQDKLVLYTFSDHIWGSNKQHSDATKQMRISALEGADQFGFDRSKFIEAVTNPATAYNSLRDEINKSSATNPLIIVAAGPMHVVGEALSRADQEKRKYVTMLSHSNWNDRHSDNPNDWENHSGWSWSDMESSFKNDGVRFIKILDQNGGSDYDGMRAAISKFSWIKNSSARNNSAYPNGSASWDWLYSRQETCIKNGDFDPSDAGMIIYLLTGIEKTNPSHARDIMENPKTTNSSSSSSSILNQSSSSESTNGACDKAYAEIESVTASGKWRKASSKAGYNGSAYFEWTGGNVYSSSNIVNSDVVTYTVNLSKADNYRIAFRGLRQQGSFGCPANAASDECNDIFVKINNGAWIKQMVKGKWSEWIWQAKHEPGHDGVINAEHNLPKGVTTIKISGRSEGVLLDAFSIYPASGVAGNDVLVKGPVAGCSDVASGDGGSSIDSLPVHGSVIKALDFTNYTLNGMVPYYQDNNREALAINSNQEANRNKWAGASIVWNGAEDNYDLKLTTLREFDGESPYRVKINGVVVGSFINGVTDQSNDYAPQVFTIVNTNLKKGDVIQVESKAVTNGLIPEGDGTAFSRGRWTQIELLGGNNNDNGNSDNNDTTSTNDSVSDIDDLTFELSDNTVTLNWSDVEGEDGYRIRRKLETESTYLNIADVASGITRYVDNAPLKGETYVYMVRPLSNSVAVAISNAVTVTIPENNQDSNANVDEQDSIPVDNIDDEITANLESVSANFNMNVVNDVMQIKLDRIQNADISIYNLNGEIVFNWKGLLDSGYNQIPLHLKSNGVFVVAFKGSVGVKVLKISISP